MSCKFDLSPCQNEDIKCNICFDGGQFIPLKQKTKYKGLRKHSEKDNRKGAHFERKNHESNQQLLNSNTIISNLTPNSGAGYIKGDERISGLVQIMEELKTKTVKQAPGKESFTIKKTWLHKLTKEAIAANMEFWYLKFSFFQDDSDTYCVVSSDVLMSFVKTIAEDRKAANLASAKILAANRQKEAAEAEVVFLKTKVAALQAQLNVKALELSSSSSPSMVSPTGKTYSNKEGDQS